MGALWQRIRAGDVGPALPGFFPEAAYAQVKAIADPQSDYQHRLVSEYSLDIAAAHALLGAGAGSAQLVTVDVPSPYVYWVPPGVSYNRVGYYEVPNSRLVYREGGNLRSFGIASMISWRGPGTSSTWARSRGRAPPGSSMTRPRAPGNPLPRRRARGWRRMRHAA